MTARQHEFERLVADFDAAAAAREPLAEMARLAKSGDEGAATRLAAAMARVAFVTPGAAMHVLDAIAEAWLEHAPGSLPSTPATEEALAELSAPGFPGPDFWAAFWAFVGDPNPGSGEEVTARIASLGGLLHESFRARALKVAETHPGAAGAASRPLPPPLTLDIFGAQPEGSLGHDFYRLILDNGFNLEVLDREAIGLAALPPALRYLNTRILQMHDVWHLVAGYRTTVLQEIGISAFQLAQFGHNYSAMVVATAAASAALNSREAFGLIMQVTAEAWMHGRTAPSFMAIEWEKEWHLPIAEIRARHGIRPFESIFPADLIEQLRVAA